MSAKIRPGRLTLDSSIASARVRAIPGPGTVDIVIGPSAGGAWRNALRPTTGRSHRRISVSHLGVTKRPGWSVVSRLLETFRKDASGVSALQHSASGTGGHPPPGLG